MRQLFLSTALVALATTATVAPVQSQQVVQPSGAQAFAPENAILNTAIPFAMGAREAQQSLRGSFGWATFQEGLVKGSYFRFDPDGYARFSPSPRLDTDVFEVICRPRTYTCMARKGALSLLLNDLGQVQLKIDQAGSSDTFFLNDGYSDIQIPARVMGVLDTQLETLLSGGGRLIVRRNGAVLEQVSLVGFPAVSAYLKWINARQDYAAMPRDWPIPNGLVPSLANQPLPLGTANLTPVQAVAVDQNEPVDPNSNAPEQGADSKPMAISEDEGDLAVLRAELQLLRDLVVAQTANPASQTTAEPAMPPMPMAPMQVGNWRSPSDTFDSFIEELVNPIDGPQDTPLSVSPPLTDEFSAEAQHLHYLTTNMGLDARTALMILQLTQLDAADSTLPALDTEEDVIARIQASMKQPNDLQIATDSAGIGEQHIMLASSGAEFRLLTDYFQSVIQR